MISSANESKLISNRSATMSQDSYEIELHNSRSEYQNVMAIEYCNSGLKIIERSDRYKKTDAFTVDLMVSVLAKGTKTIFLRGQGENKFSAPVETVGNTAAGNSIIENRTTAN